MAFGVGNVNGKLLVKEEILHSGNKALFIQRHTDIGEGGIAGLGKGAFKGNLAMFASVEAADGVLSMGIAAVALVGVIGPGIRIFTDVFQ